MECALMGRRFHRGFTAAEKTELWDRWKRGECCVDRLSRHLISGHAVDGTACQVCAMCGRLRVGKSFLHVLQHWSVQPCVRPVDAVHMTAGHNALRGSGPGHKPAFDNA